MTQMASRRGFLAGVGAVSLSGLAGCSARRVPGWNEGPDRTLYVGAYHWGFILLDETGTERERIELEAGSRIRIVAFGAGADEAVATLPEEIQTAFPGHETLAARNEAKIPAPSEEYLHDALEYAEERYPDHSLAIIPAGMNQMDGGMMGGGMMGNAGMPLPHDASEPTTTTLTADQRGYFTLICGVYCGYGHQYMYTQGGLVVR